MKNRILIYLIGTIFFTISCSTEKNTFITRTYHNITARYNAFFNGKESFKKGLKKVDESFKDDYTHILPLFKYGDESIAESIKPEMDRAIDKATKVIKRHSITAKPKNIKEKLQEGKSLSNREEELYEKTEYNKWVDDSYLMMGKAHFYKDEYMMAIKNFRYILREFTSDKIKYKALIWLARLDNERQEFREAKDILKKIKEQYTKHIDKKFYTTYADYHLKKDQYEEAIDHLHKAIQLENDRDRRIRYRFILAQIYQKTGRLTKASRYYEKVIQKNPAYEMEFNAKINKATCYQKGSGNYQEVKEQLFDMLNDDKNIEYQDQIYYSLGNLAKNQGHTQQALQYYKKSTSKSVSNDIQKTTSYLSIADIYYDQEKFKKAGQYYDSASAFITEDYPDYQRIKEKTDLLIRLVDHLNTIEKQDSLQRLAQMSKAERMKVINQAIEAYKEKKRREKQQRARQRQQTASPRAPFSQNQGRQSQSGKWYFYNPGMVKRGKKQFKSKWGNRELQDNWRRSNKSTEDMGSFAKTPSTDQSSQEGKQSKPTTQSSKTDPQHYLQDIPLDDSAMKKSNHKLREALYKVARIYQNELNDDQKAMHYYKRLADRFPHSNLTLLSYYQLYELNQKHNHSVEANKYKQKILSQYPESTYAKILKNPDYLENMQAKRNEASQLYQKTYNLYKNNQYSKVRENVKKAREKHPKRKTLLKKFEYLNLLASAKMDPPQTLEQKIKAYIEKYPQTPQTQQAKNMLAKLYKHHPELQKAKLLKAAKKTYNPHPKSKHYFVMASDTNADMNQLVFNLVNFNVEHYKKMNLNVNNKKVSKTKQIAIVKGFPGKKETWAYYQKVKTKKDTIFKDVQKDRFTYFVISKPNYQKFSEEEQAIEKYTLYFKDYYDKADQ